MKRLSLAVSLMLSAWTARAYDAQIGDTLMELRISPTEQGVSFGQFLTPRVPVSVVAAMSLAGGYGNTPVGSLSLRAGYEQHHQGSAIVPRAAVEMGWLTTPRLGFLVRSAWWSCLVRIGPWVWGLIWDCTVGSAWLEWMQH